MKIRAAWLAGLASVCGMFPVMGWGAVVYLTLFNTEPLLDYGAVPLMGNETSGDLVQLIYSGGNGVIDVPDANGNPGGDDSIAIFLQFNPTHVGAGRPSTSNDGLLEQALLSYDSSWVTSNAFVRFWNASTPAGATGYGDSEVFGLPAGNGLGFALQDFATGPADAHQITFGWLSGPVPEPGTMLFGGLGFFLLIVRRKWQECKRTGAIW